MAMYNYTPNVNYYGANETEEERRRRLQQEQTQQLGGVPAIAPIAPLGVEPEPIKQTITYDPVSGEQRMKIEGNARDLSAENPLTPTLTMPGAVSPEQMEQQRQMELAAQQQEQARAQQQMELAAQQQEQAQAQQQMPQPGPAVQVASVAPGLPQTQPAQPYMGPGQGVEAQTVGAPVQQPVQQQPVQKTPMDVFTEAAGDTNKLLQIYNDKNQSPELRRMAGREAGRMLDAETRRAEAEEQVKNMSQSDIARLLRSKSDEGSWGKRVLFGLLNMQGAMAQEDAKLGIGAKYQSTNINGTPVLIKVRADGKPMEGYDATTGNQLNNKDLVAAMAQMTAVKGTEVEAGTYLDPTGNVPGNWVLERRPGGSAYRQVGTGAIATEQQANALRKTGVQGTLADQQARQIQELQNKLNFAGPNASAAERERIIAESEARFGLLPEAYKAQVRGAAPQPAATTQAQPATAAAAQPAQLAAAAPAAGTQPAAAPAAQKTPPVSAQAAPGGGVKLSVTPGGATPAARESAMRTNEAAIKERLETEATIERERRKPGAQATGKLEAKDINNQGYADSTYGLIRPISDAIRQSTGSSIGAGADKLAGVVGVGTQGAQNIARLEVLGYQLLSNVPRFEGPQSELDVKLYQQAAGDLANSSKPVNVRLAALDSIVMMLKKYDKAGNNDWTFGQPGGNIKIIKREKVQ